MSKEDSQKAYVDKVIEVWVPPSLRPSSATGLMTTTFVQIFMREGGGQTYIDQINAA
mgnify:CR=1 FL=1